MEGNNNSHWLPLGFLVLVAVLITGFTLVQLQILDLKRAETDSIAPMPVGDDADDEAVPVDVSDDTVIDGVVYHNVALGFSLLVPDDKWSLPSSTDRDPHLYATVACASMERSDCAAFEIQNHDEDSMDTAAVFAELKASGQNPVELPNLILGAYVIKSTAPGPAEGWEYEYDVFFKASGSERRFLIFTNDLVLEEFVLPSFKLTPVEAASWSTFTSKDLGYSVNYEKGVTPKQSQDDVIFKGGDVSFDVRRTEAGSTSLSQFFYLDFPSAGIIKVGSMSASVVNASKGYCDGPGCGPAFKSYTFLDGGYFYTVVFYGDTTVSDEEVTILNSFKFID